MNPLTNMKNLTKINERELALNVAGTKGSWHNEYKDSAWVFVGGLAYELTEGDVICIFSQFGEIVNINLVRDRQTKRSRGFCFLCYEDQRSTVLAVDNLNGIKVVGRFLRVDHVEEYRVPKEHEDLDEVTRQLHEEGCGAGSGVFEAAKKAKEEFEGGKERERRVWGDGDNGIGRRDQSWKDERRDGIEKKESRGGIEKGDRRNGIEMKDRQSGNEKRNKRDYRTEERGDGIERRGRRDGIEKGNRRDYRTKERGNGIEKDNRYDEIEKDNRRDGIEKDNRPDGIERRRDGVEKDKKHERRRSRSREMRDR